MNRLIIIALAVCFALTCLHGPALTQEKGKAQTPTPRPQLQQMTVQGQILKNPAMGGYYLKGVTEVFIIANQNPAVLEPLVKSGQSVTIIAKPNGDILTIEKLNGKPYTGKQEPVFK